MKIISSFKDYYDQCWSDDVVYRRETREIGWNDPEFPDKKEWNSLVNIGDKYKFDAGVVGDKWLRCYTPLTLSFCGVLYNLYRVRTDGNPCYYSSEAVINIVSPDTSNVRHIHNKIKSFFNRGSIDTINLHKKYNTAILLVVGGGLYINPNLKEIGFDTIMSKNYAYQEIEKFICNVLESEEIKEPLPLSDTTKILSKGFDLKHSFRKEKVV